MKMRLLHQAVMVAMIGALPLAAGAAGNTTSSDNAKQMPSASQSSPNAGPGTTTKGPEATSKGEQGKADINAGSTDRSANKDTDKQSASNNMGSASKSAKLSPILSTASRRRVSAPPRSAAWARAM